MRRWTKLMLYLAAILIPISLLWFVMRPWPKPEITFLGMVERDGEEFARFKVQNPHNISFSYRAYKDTQPWGEAKGWSRSEWVLLRPDCTMGKSDGDGWRILSPEAAFEFEMRRPNVPCSRFLMGIPFHPKIITDPPPGTAPKIRRRTFWENCETKLHGLDGVEWYTWSPPVTFTKERNKSKL